MEVNEELLVNLVQEFGLENQKAPGIKKRIWQDIMEKYKDTEGIEVATDLLKAWNTIKVRCRRRKMAQTKAFKGTGGGPPAEPLDDLTEKILGIIGYNVEVPSRYDSEAVAHHEESLQLRVSFSGDKVSVTKHFSLTCSKS